MEHDDEIFIINSMPGQYFHMYLGLVRGSQYSHKDKKWWKITSKDEYNSYCIIIDSSSRYIWILLTSFIYPPISVHNMYFIYLKAETHTEQSKGTKEEKLVNFKNLAT